jgi:hypothetical protein
VPPLDAAHDAPPGAGDPFRQTIQQPLPRLAREGLFLLEPGPERLCESFALAERAEPAAQLAQDAALLAARGARAARMQHVERGVEPPDRHARVVDRHGIRVAKLLGRLAELLELAAGVLLHRRLGLHTGSADSRGFGWSSNRVTR